MSNDIPKLSKNERLFIDCILEKGNLTDIEIVKKTGLSKATCSRIRKKLESTLIREYMPIIDLHKVGINVFLILTFNWKAFNNKGLTKKAFAEFENDPRVIFLANGEGSISSTVLFMAFKDLEQHYEYLKDFRERYSTHTDNIHTLILPSKEVIKHDFTDVIKQAVGGTKK